MKEEELLQLYGLEPDEVHREAIRQLLQQKKKRSRLKRSV